MIGSFLPIQLQVRQYVSSTSNIYVRFILVFREDGQSLSQVSFYYQIVYPHVFQVAGKFFSVEFLLLKFHGCILVYWSYRARLIERFTTITYFSAYYMVRVYPLEYTAVRSSDQGASCDGRFFIRMERSPSTYFCLLR